MFMKLAKTNEHCGENVLCFLSFLSINIMRALLGLIEKQHIGSYRRKKVTNTAGIVFEFISRYFVMHDFSIALISIDIYICVKNMSNN